MWWNFLKLFFPPDYWQLKKGICNRIFLYYCYLPEFENLPLGYQQDPCEHTGVQVWKELNIPSPGHSKIDFITLFASKNPRIEINSETSKKTSEITLLEETSRSKKRMIQHWCQQQIVKFLLWRNLHILVDGLEWPTFKN
jgi:hypothetical protein